MSNPRWPGHCPGCAPEPGEAQLFLSPASEEEMSPLAILQEEREAQDGTQAPWLQFKMGPGFPVFHLEDR